MREHAHQVEKSPGTAAVDLYWIPVGAGDQSPWVRRGSSIYESFVAKLEGRPRLALFHSALVVHADGRRYVIEMAPEWADRRPDRGVVAHGPVGSRRLGRSAMFRYEVRRWRDGVLPDQQWAVPGAIRVSGDETVARRVLDLVPSFPTSTWGRDEYRTGDMWNSNSLTSWLLVASGHDVRGLQPPTGGRAPGWTAGLMVGLRHLPLLAEDAHA